MTSTPRPIPLNEIAARLRTRPNVSPLLVQLAAKNRAELEAKRALIRSCIETFQKGLGAVYNVDPRVFAQVPADVIEHLIAAGIKANALSEIPKTEISIDYRSIVTVNGVPVPDEE
ncbi:hypothetical protein [Neorhizobium petrolearium]|uniref:hypothetical protein n=1 Tax=Neorhizobium petrolearium TaxID=515361 RepID=UPI003F14AF6B